MNKAFVKEPDAPDPCCPDPRCGGAGLVVSAQTLRAQLSADDAAQFKGAAFWCPSPGCPVAYYDAWGVRVEGNALRRGVHPKIASAPLCPCFDIGAEALIDDACAGRREVVRDLVQKARSPAARCAQENPSGRSCEPEARKLFLRYFSPGGG